MNKVEAQVFYQGRWVSRAGFRAWVYNSSGQQLAENYTEYSKLISSGEWFGTLAEVDNKPLTNENVVAMTPQKRKRVKNECAE